MVRELTSGSLPGLSGRSPGEGRGRDPVGEAAVAFASLLVKELLKTSLGSGRTPGLFPSGLAGDVCRDVFLDTMAREVAAAGSFPLAAQVVRYMNPGGAGIPVEREG